MACKKSRQPRSSDVTANRRDPRLYQIAVLAGLLVFGLTVLDFDLTLAQVAVTLGVAVGAQLACGRIAGLRGDTGSRSALISGLSLCLLLRTDVLLTAAAAAAFAIASKFVLRVGRKHLLNPTNGAIVGLLALSTAAPTLELSIWVSPGQWGNTAFFLLLMGCLGTVVVTRAARADVTFAFLASWAGLLLFRAWSLGDPTRDSPAPPAERRVAAVCVLHDLGSEDDARLAPWPSALRRAGGSGRVLRAVQVVPHQRPVVVAGRVFTAGSPHRLARAGHALRVDRTAHPGVHP